MRDQKPLKDVYYRERERTEIVGISWRSSLPMISCELAERNRLKSVFCRRENHRGGCRALTRPKSWCRVEIVSLGAASRQESGAVHLNEGGGGDGRRCARQIEHPRRDNIITGRVLWGVRACNVQRACIRAPVRYACNVTTEHAIADPIPRDSNIARPRRYERTKRRTRYFAKFTLDDL